MKSDLKKLDLRITELSHYLEISRPTLYQYMSDFEEKKYKNIDSRILNVFRFIKKTSTKNKLQVINYIIQTQKDTSLISNTMLEKLEILVEKHDCEEELLKLINYLMESNANEMLIKINNNLKGDTND